MNPLLVTACLFEDFLRSSASIRTLHLLTDGGGTPAASDSTARGNCAWKGCLYVVQDEVVSLFSDKKKAA
jgi:hypothetical protein